MISARSSSSISSQIERHVAEGVPEHERVTRSLRMFGSVESLKEECRDARDTALVDHLRRVYGVGSGACAQLIVHGIPN